MEYNFQVRFKALQNKLYQQVLTYIDKKDMHKPQG